MAPIGVLESKKKSSFFLSLSHTLSPRNHQYYTNTQPTIKKHKKEEEIVHKPPNHILLQTRNQTSPPYTPKKKSSNQKTIFGNKICFFSFRKFFLVTTSGTIIVPQANIFLFQNSATGTHESVKWERKWWSIITISVRK